MVINMKIRKEIKTRLYFISSVFLLTAVCVMVYTSMRNGNDSKPEIYESQQGQADTAREQTDEVQQVSSTSRQEDVEQDLATAKKKTDKISPEQPQEITYRLAVQEGYLQVYVVQTGSLYMETEIAYDLLPLRVQDQIREGKYFQSQEELLEFLENYSS